MTQHFGGARDHFIPPLAGDQDMQTVLSTRTHQIDSRRHVARYELIDY